MMSNEKLHNNQIGLRIRTARKEKGINQTELANLLGKSLRTIQKYESGEIEVSIAMLNEIAKDLDCESTYPVSYTHLDVYKRQIIDGSSPYKRITVRIGFYFCTIDKKFFQCDQTFFEVL